MRPFFLLVIFILGFFEGVRSFCVEEFYSNRPRIARFESMRRQSGLPRENSFNDHLNDQHWASSKHGMLRFLATLSFYPENYEFYFLGRDAEPLFDLAERIFSKDSRIKKRLHLINVSRPSLKDPNLWSYLAQEGISLPNVAKGKRFLLVDTGMRGTIPDEIRKSAPPEFTGQIQAHFLLSANSAYPSSRSFLYSVEPEALRKDVTDFESTILEFENLDYFTFSVVRYEKMQGHWEAITGPSYQAPGSSLQSLMGAGFGMGHDLLPMATDRNPKNAARLQRDLFEFSQMSSTRIEFERAQELWIQLKQAYVTSIKKQNSGVLLSQLIRIRAQATRQDRLPEAIVRDAVDLLKKNDPLLGRFGISLRETERGSATGAECQRGLQ
jgi:hypothetical protein